MSVLYLLLIYIVILTTTHSLRMPIPINFVKVHPTSNTFLNMGGSETWVYDPKKIRNFSIIAHIGS